MSTTLKNITLKHLLIDGQKCIGLKYYPDKVLHALIKQLPSPKWSDAYSMVYLPNTYANLDAIMKTFKGVAWLNGQHFFSRAVRPFNEQAPDIDHYRKRSLTKGYIPCPENYLQKLEVRKYALNTARSYIAHFEKFINSYKQTTLNEIGEHEIRDYISALVKKGYSDSYINISINSIKFYYEVVMGMPNRFYSIERPIKKEKLPEVLSKQEVLNMISCTKNIKHKCMIKLLYSAGLRRNELLQLELKDIESSRMLIKIRDGKGNKDRYTLLSQSLLIDLRKYYKIYRPKTLLFEGYGQQAYSGTSLAKIVKKAALSAKIKKHVKPHMLRHSFATHMLEEGVDLRYIQALMGHSSSKTTEIYTHVAVNGLRKIKNLLD